MKLSKLTGRPLMTRDAFLKKDIEKCQHQLKTEKRKDWIEYLTNRIQGRKNEIDNI